MVLTVRDVGEMYGVWIDYLRDVTTINEGHNPWLVAAILTAALVVAKTLRGDQGWGG